MAASKNAKTNNSKPTVINQTVAKQPASKQTAKTTYKSPGTEAVDRAFDAATEYCKSDPKTAKRIGGSIMLGAGIGIAVGGGLMITSTF